MSKIEVTEEQAAKLDAVWRNVGFPATRAEAYTTVSNELVAMGLVRPASDDLTARVAALEARVNGPTEVVLDVSKWPTIKVPASEALDIKAEVVLTPDPHAAAKERAKLWGASWLSILQHSKQGWAWATSDYLWEGSKWIRHEDSQSRCCAGLWDRSVEYKCFPTVPPPGWGAAKSPLSICGIPVDPTPKNSKPVPRTEADRLGKLCREAWWGDMKHAKWEDIKDAQETWREAAHAIRKAILAGQLEPSEEEVLQACTAYKNNPAQPGNPMNFVEYSRMKHALIAAARVRLEKADGEKP